MDPFQKDIKRMNRIDKYQQTGYSNKRNRCRNGNIINTLRHRTKHCKALYSLLEVITENFYTRKF